MLARKGSSAAPDGAPLRAARRSGGVDVGDGWLRRDDPTWRGLAEPEFAELDRHNSCGAYFLGPQGRWYAPGGYNGNGGTVGPTAKLSVGILA